MQPFPDAGGHLLGDLDSLRRVHPPAGLVVDWPAMTGTLTLRSDEPLAVELTAALKHGEVDRLRRLLAANPGLAHCVVENPKVAGKVVGEHRCIFSPIGRGTIRTLSTSFALSLRAAPTSMRRRSGCSIARRHCIGRPAMTIWR